MLQDEQGVVYTCREWMQLVSREILDPSYGLFLYADDDCCTVRLNPDSAVNPVYALSSNWRVHTQPPNGTELIVVPETNVIAQLERPLKDPPTSREKCEHCTDCRSHGLR